MGSRLGGISKNFVTSGVLGSTGLQRKKGTRGAIFISVKNASGTRTGGQALGDRDLHPRGPFSSLVFLFVFVFMGKHVTPSENCDLGFPCLMVNDSISFG